MRQGSGSFQGDGRRLVQDWGGEAPIGLLRETLELERANYGRTSRARRRDDWGRMVHGGEYALAPIAWVRSPLTDLGSAPKQAHEGAPQAWLVFDLAVLDGLDGLRVGDRVVVLTWLHRADRDVLVVHPRGDVANPLQGVFSTRSPARPNPIGMHEVRILEIEGPCVRVDALEAVDGTPIVDIKPVLRSR